MDASIDSSWFSGKTQLQKQDELTINLLGGTSETKFGLLFGKVGNDTWQSCYRSLRKSICHRARSQVIEKDHWSQSKLPHDVTPSERGSADLDIDLDLDLDLGLHMDIEIDMVVDLDIY